MDVFGSDELVLKSIEGMCGDFHFDLRYALLLYNFISVHVKHTTPTYWAMKVNKEA